MVRFDMLDSFPFGGVATVSHPSSQKSGAELPPNGLELSRLASPGLVSRKSQAWAGQVGSGELLGRPKGVLRRDHGF